VPRWAGWKSLPESGFPKAPPRCHQLTRGVRNNIEDFGEGPGACGEGSVLDPPFAGKFQKTKALGRMHGLQC